MHMADALISPAVGGSCWAAAIGILAYASRRLQGRMSDRLVPLMGVLGAFVFAGQMVNFAIPGTGSSGHLGGGLLLAIILGPHAAFITIASILIVQALFFADGGILALGSNILNLGFYPCYISYPFIFRVIVGKDQSARRIGVASVLSAVAAFQLGALSVVIQTVLSGIADLSPGSFLLLMMPIHLIIGIVEGIITAGIVLYARNLQPEILDMNEHNKKSLPVKKVVIVFSILALLSGVVFSRFASIHPDGLEWSLKNSSGLSEPTERNEMIANKALEIQKATALLPDYEFPSNSEDGDKKRSRQWIDGGTSVSGLVGGMIVLTVVMLSGFIMRAITRYRKRT